MKCMSGESLIFFKKKRNLDVKLAKLGYDTARTRLIYSNRVKQNSKTEA